MGGAQLPVGRGNEPKKTGARSARARTRGQNPLVLNTMTRSYTICYRNYETAIVTSLTYTHCSTIFVLLRSGEIHFSLLGSLYSHTDPTVYLTASSPSYFLGPSLVLAKSRLNAKCQLHAESRKKCLRRAMHCKDTEPKIRN
jgi:hypothetical protein